MDMNNVNGNNGNDDFWGFLSRLENEDVPIDEAKQYKAKASLPLYITGGIFFLYMVAVFVARFVLHLSLPADALWIAEGLYVINAVIIPLCVSHPEPVFQEESRMLTLMAFSGCLAVIALTLI